MLGRYGQGKMYFYGRRVKETLMTATLRSGDVLAVVTFLGIIASEGLLPSPDAPSPSMSAPATP